MHLYSCMSAVSCCLLSVILCLFSIFGAFMDNIDQQQIDTATNELWQSVWNLVQGQIASEHESEFKDAILKKLENFVTIDRPYDLDESKRIFEQCLRLSVFARLPSHPEFGYSPEESAVLWNEMSFKPSKKLIFGFTSGVNKKEKQLQRIEDEVERIKECITQRKECVPKNLFNGLLSEEANTQNNQVFTRYYQYLKDVNKLYLSQGAQLAQYIDPIVQQVRTMEQQAITQYHSSLSESIRKKRSQEKMVVPPRPNSTF